jgi:hypothetical protein
MSSESVEPEYLSFFTNTTITEPASMTSNNTIMNGENMNYQELLKRLPIEENKSTQDLPNKLSSSIEYTPVIVDYNTPTQQQIIQTPLINTPIQTQPTSQVTTIIKEVPISQPIKNKTRTLYFNTEFRPNYNGTKSTDCIIPISYPLKNVISSKLVDINLSSSYANFSQNNGTNTFTYTIDDNKYNVEIPEGNYSINDFLEMINTHPDIYQNLFFEIDKITRFTSVRSLNDSTFTIDFTSTNIDNERSLGWLLGFREKVYKNQCLYKSSCKYSGDKPKSMYLVINDYNISDSNSQVLLLGNTYIEQNISGRILINGEGNLKIDSKKRIYNEPVTITKIAIKLLNEYGENVNLNNMDYTFAIEFELNE